MNTVRGIRYGVAVTGLLGFAFIGWAHVNSASAQTDGSGQDTNAPVAGGFRQQGRNRMGPIGMGMRGATALAASNGYVFVLRGNTVYQLRATDLSLVRQQDLPGPGNGFGGGGVGPGGAPGQDGTGNNGNTP